MHHDLRKSIAALRDARPPAHEKRWISQKTRAVLARLHDPDWRPDLPNRQSLYFEPTQDEDGGGIVEVGEEGGEGGEGGEGDEEWVEGEYEGEGYGDEGYEDRGDGYGVDEETFGYEEDEGNMAGGV